MTEPEALNKFMRCCDECDKCDYEHVGIRIERRSPLSPLWVCSRVCGEKIQTDRRRMGLRAADTVPYSEDLNAIHFQIGKLHEDLRKAESDVRFAFMDVRDALYKLSSALLDLSRNVEKDWKTEQELKHPLGS